MSGRTSRRRTDSGSVTVIYWSDIPAQVTATRSGEVFKRLLEPRFQEAIDRAAARAGKTETHAYVAEWRKERRAIAGELKSEAEACVTDLEASYPQARLEALVRTGGQEQAFPADPVQADSGIETTNQRKRATSD